MTSRSRPLLFAVAGLLLVLTGIGASCSGSSRETTPSAPVLAEARLPRTDLRLLVITDLLGYLEPCGCTSRPLGGIDRLSAAITDLRDDGAPTLFVSAGDLFFEAGDHGVELAEAATQEIWKAETVADVLSRLDLAAAAPGPLDMRFGVERLRALRDRARFPLLAAGTSIAGAEGAPVPLGGHIVREVGALRVGIVGISDLEGEGVTRSGDPIELARAEAHAARQEGAELVVVLARLPRRLANRIARGVEGIDVVVLGGLDAQQPIAPSTEEGAAIVHAAHQGVGVLALDLMRGAGSRWLDASTWTRSLEHDRVRHEIDQLRARIAEWERDPAVHAADLDEQRRRMRGLEGELREIATAPEISGRALFARFVELPPEHPRDAAVTALLETYFRRVNEHNRTAFASLLPRPAAEGRPRYVGTEACGGCHAEEIAWWRTTLHGRAYRTLEERHKEYNLSCVGCHVTGYNQPGGSTVAHVGALQDVGCENCHGPGSRHVLDRESPPEVNVHREVTEETCTGCHNPEHSDRFHYETYRRMMIAPGHGA